MKRTLLLLALPVAACHPDHPATTGPPAALPAVQTSPAAPAQAFTPPTGSLRSSNTKRPTDPDHNTLHVPGGGVLYLKPNT